MADLHQPQTTDIQPSQQREHRTIVGKAIYGFNNAINGALERAFEALGRLVGKRPILVIIVSLVVAIILSAGRVFLEKETRGEKLWVPEDNESQRNNDFVQDNFPSLGTGEVIYLERVDGGDVITPEAFDLALSIHNQVVSLMWKNRKDEDDPNSEKEVSYLPETQTLQDLCLNTQGGEGGADVLNCSMVNPLELFGYNSASWADRDTLLATLNDPSTWNADLAEPGFILEQVLGGLQKSEDGNIAGARVLAFTYFLAGNKTLIDDDDDDDANLGWEEEFLDLLEELDETDATWHIHRAAGRSADDEFGSTVTNDLALLNVAVTAIAIFTYIAISDWQDSCVGSRSLLTIGGLLNILLAYAACEGFTGYIGLLYSDLALILPFIMLGVGVDGMFVLQGAMDATNPEDSMEVRMGEVIRTGGLSVAAASVTNFGAFMIGSNTSLPALSAFSVMAAIGLLFDLLLQITCFAGIMAIDKKRQENRRLDVALCAKSPSDEPLGYCCGAFGPASGEQLRTRLMKNVGALYTKKWMKAVVISLWLVLLVAGIYGTSQMKVDADVNDFIPSGSYLRDYLDTQTEQFGETGTVVHLYWVNDAQEGKPLDFSDPTVQQQMDQSLELIRGNEFVAQGTLSSWWEELKGNGSTPVDYFYPRLTAFLATDEGKRHLGDLTFVDEDPRKELLAARSAFQWRFIEETQEQIDALDSVRGTTAQIPAPLGPSTFAHSVEFLNIEQYKSIGREAFMNIGLGFLMIAIMVFFLISNPVAAVLTFIAVASAIVELVGFMYFRGTYIDSTSVIFIVISLGLAVDYSVHVAHGYLSTREGDPRLRLQKTMGQTGAAVLNGVLSTLIAAMCLSGSKSYVFMTFFYALLFIVLCGAFSGVVLLPVLLDIFRPPYNADVAITHAVDSQQPQNSTDKVQAAQFQSAPAAANGGQFVSNV